MQEKIKQCEAHGFKVRKERNWLWLTDTDGRYKKENTKTDRINLDQEAKVLFALGFKYSKSRGAYYWDGTDYQTLYEQAKQRAEQLKQGLEQNEVKYNQLVHDRVKKIGELMDSGKIEEAKSLLENVPDEEMNLKQEIQYKKRKLAEIEKEIKRYEARLKAAENI